MDEWINKMWYIHTLECMYIQSKKIKGMKF